MSTLREITVPLMGERMTVRSRSTLACSNEATAWLTWVFAGLTAFFFASPGSVYRATQSGTWGDARESTPEFGERYLSVVTEATVRMLDDIARTHAAMPAR